MHDDDQFEAESEVREVAEVVGDAVAFEAAMVRASSASKSASSSWWHLRSLIHLR